MDLTREQLLELLYKTCLEEFDSIPNFRIALIVQTIYATEVADSSKYELKSRRKPNIRQSGKERRGRLTWK